MKAIYTLKITSLKSLFQNKIPGEPVVIISLILLFIVSIVYFYWSGKGVFLYQEKRSLFIYSYDYLQKYLVKPGGLLEYTGNFLIQIYYNNFQAALLLSAVFILVTSVFIQINKQLSDEKSYSVFFILFPSCLLMLLQKDYDHLMHFNLGYLLVITWFLFSIFLERRGLSFLILVLSPLFYYLAGSFIFIYLGMFILYNIVYRKGISRFLSPVFIIIVALITFLIFKEVIFLQPVGRLLCYPLNFYAFSTLPFLLNLLNVYFLLFPLIIKASGYLKVNQKLRGFLHFVTIMILISLTGIFLFKKNNPVLENIIELDRMVYSQNWDGIIQKYESATSSDLIEQYYYNIALSEKGQLCERLFFGPQEFGVESLALSRDSQFLDRSVYFYYTTGLISEAHHLAVESMVLNGYRPEIVKLIIKTELINGNSMVADRFINVLNNTLYYRKWTGKYKKMVHDTSLIKRDAELGKKIKMLPGMDFFVMFNDMQNIELLLVSNPANKIAFEYKMARLLFEKDLEAVVNGVKKMKEMGYSHIPKHIEESVMQFVSEFNKIPDFGGLTISPETETRFKKYRESITLHSGTDETSLKEKMKNEWGNTFWYYYQFR